MIGLSGEANRKMFLNEQRLDFAASTEIFRLGPEFVPPVHAIYDQSFHNGRSYFVRRLLDLQKSELLVKRLPRVTRDARAAFDALAKSPSNVVNPTSTCYRLVVVQDCRILCCDEIPDDPKQLNSCIDYLMTLRTAIDLQGSFLPWLPSKQGFRRRYATYCLNSLIAPIVHSRMKKGSPRKDDALQTLVDNGDSKEYILRFLPNQLFIASANAGYLVGAMLNIVAHHEYWQEKIFAEIKATALKHSKAKGAPLVDQLDSIPLDAWESSFPSIDLCYKEAVRMWIAFPMLRLNVASEPLPIPRTSEVIPPGAFVAYHTADVHYNEELYPNPTKYDPERFLEGREEFKRQNFGCEYPRVVPSHLQIAILHVLEPWSISGVHSQLRRSLNAYFIETYLPSLSITDSVLHSRRLGRRVSPLPGNAMGKAPADSHPCLCSRQVQVDRVPCRWITQPYVRPQDPSCPVQRRSTSGSLLQVYSSKGDLKRTVTERMGIQCDYALGWRGVLCRHAPFVHYLRLQSKLETPLKDFIPLRRDEIISYRVTRSLASKRSSMERGCLALNSIIAAI